MLIARATRSGSYKHFIPAVTQIPFPILTRTESNAWCSTGRHERARPRLRQYHPYSGGLLCEPGVHLFSFPVAT
jgi:hypothetical protein